MIDWPESLVTDLARRRAVLVLGSGVSRHAVGEKDVRPPDWKGFLELALDKCPDPKDHIKEAIDNGDWLHACEWLKHNFDEKWTKFLTDTFVSPKFMPGNLHRKILTLDSRIVFSLNFDNVYERAAENMHQGSHIIKSYHDQDISEFLRGDGRYIVKAHGTLNTPNKLIFTRKDYANARIENVSFYQAFDACLLTHSFVFIGAGYNDPDIALLLENQAFGFPSTQPHYFISSRLNNEDIKRSLRINRNLKTLEYDKIDNDHTGLVIEIDKLNELVEYEKSRLADSLNW